MFPNSFSNSISMSEAVELGANYWKNPSEPQKYFRSSQRDHGLVTRGKNSDKKILKIENRNGGSAPTQAPRESGNPSLEPGLMTDQRHSGHCAGDRGDINVFIPQGQMTMDEAIVQGEAYFAPNHLEISIQERPETGDKRRESGVHLNISVQERKLSFTQLVPGLETRQESWYLDLENKEHEEEEDGGGDDMDEMTMPNPGSIEHFEKLFYPKIPCKNCSTCWDNFAEEIKWF